MVGNLSTAAPDATPTFRGNGFLVVVVLQHMCRHPPRSFAIHTYTIPNLEWCKCGSNCGRLRRLKPNRILSVYGSIDCFTTLLVIFLCFCLNLTSKFCLCYIILSFEVKIPGVGIVLTILMKRIFVARTKCMKSYRTIYSKNCESQ